MAEFDELTEILKHLLTNMFAPKPSFIRGLLGDGTGVVNVPNRDDHHFARFSRGASESFEVFNKETPAIDNWPVLIGELPWQPGLTQVVGTDWASYEAAGWGEAAGGLVLHAPIHEWRDGLVGADPMSVYLRSIAPLRAYAVGSGTTDVFVNAYEYDPSGTVWPGAPSVNVSAPMQALTTGNTQFLGVYLDPNNNTLGIVTGETSVFTPAFDPPNVAFPIGVIPSARIKIHGGQGGLSENDFRDARRPFTPGVTGGHPSPPAGPAGGDLTGAYPNPQVVGLAGTVLENTTPSEGDILMVSGSAWIPLPLPAGGWPFANVLTVSPTDPEADFTEIQDALLEASAGDVILCDAFTNLGQLEITKAVTIVGAGERDTVISSSGNPPMLVSGTGAALVNLEIVNSVGGFLTSTVRARTDCVFRNCKVTNNETLTTIGVLADNASTVRFVDCDIETTATGSFALATSGAGTIAEIIGGTYNGPAADVDVGASTTVKFLEAPSLLDGQVSGAGTAQGWYITSSGNQISAGNERLGIGEAAPSRKLHIGGADPAGGLIIDVAIAGQTGIEVTSTITNALTSIHMFRAAPTLVPQRTASNPTIYGMNFDLRVLSDTASVVVGSLYNNFSRMIMMPGNTADFTNVMNYYAVGILDSNSGANTVTRLYAFRAGGITDDANTVYGFHSNINIGSNTNYNFYASGAADNFFSGRVGVGINVPVAKLHIDQASTTANIPVLYLDQADISEEIIWFRGESAAGAADRSLVDASDFTTPGALLGWIKHKVDDQRGGGLGTIDVWVPFYAIPTA